jgi:hypothetical protein
LALNQISLIRPGTASVLTPNAGIAKAWMTSAPVTSTLTVASTGTTTSLSTASSRG